MLVDSLGMVLAVVVTEANLGERLGGAAVVMEIEALAQNLKVIWVDAGYQGKNFERVIRQLCDAQVEVIRRSDKGFKVLPKRWIVEPPFGWLNHYRRLSKDYELLPEVSETMIYVAMIRLMLRRLTQKQSQSA